MQILKYKTFSNSEDFEQWQLEKYKEYEKKQDKKLQIISTSPIKKYSDEERINGIDMGLFVTYYLI